MDSNSTSTNNDKIRVSDKQLRELKDVIGQLEEFQKVEIYNSELNESYIKPIVSNKKKSVWAQYTLRHKQRNKIIKILQANNINTAVYYPIPLHKQLAFKKCPKVFSGLKNSDKFSKEVFSIPMNPYLKENDQSRIIDILNKI